MSDLSTVLLSVALVWLGVPVAEGGKLNPPTQVNTTECAYSAQDYCCPNSRRVNFRKDRIVPDVLKSEPEYIMKVIYSSGQNYVTHVCLGNVITSDRTLLQPEVSWPADSNKLYTLVMYGRLLSFDHWIVGNIPGDDVSAGETISSYFPPAPPPATGSHGYIFAAFEQELGQICYGDFPILRPFFDFKGFVEHYKLKLHAANFFLCVSNLTPSGQAIFLK